MISTVWLRMICLRSPIWSRDLESSEKGLKHPLWPCESDCKLARQSLYGAAFLKINRGCAESEWRLALKNTTRVHAWWTQTCTSLRCSNAFFDTSRGTCIAGSILNGFSRKWVLLKSMYYFDLRFVNFVNFGLRGGQKNFFRFVANFKSTLFFICEGRNSTVRSYFFYLLCDFEIWCDQNWNNTATATATQDTSGIEKYKDPL